MRALPLLGLVLAVMPLQVAAHAQAPSHKPAVRRRFAVATNPVAPFFGAYSAEVEAPLGDRGFTTGVGGTYDSDRENMSWAEAKLLFYPGHRPLEGLSLGVTAGVATTRGGFSAGCGGVPPQSCGPETDTAPMAGVLLGYNLLFGPRRQVLFGAGVGAQYLFIGESSETRLRQGQLDGRFVLGWAF